MSRIGLCRCSRASFGNRDIAGLTQDNVLVDLSKSRESFFTPQQHLQLRCDWLCSNKLLLHIPTDLRTQVVCVTWSSDSAHPVVIQPKWGKKGRKKFKKEKRRVEAGGGERRKEGNKK